MARRTPASVPALTEFGRERLSRSFFMRDFLFSEIAAIHGLPNVPDDPEAALASGRRLCEELLEPIQDRFGRIVIRSAFRSEAVNGYGNAAQLEKRKGYSCAANEANFGRHIWDRVGDLGAGATACIVVPSVWDRFRHEPTGWRRLAWWVHDHLPYSELEFFPTYWAFNIGWAERPARTIYSRVPPDTGYLTRPGFDGHDDSHEDQWRPLVN